MKNVKIGVKIHFYFLSKLKLGTSENTCAKGFKKQISTQFLYHRPFFSNFVHTFPSLQEHFNNILEFDQELVLLHFKGLSSTRKVKIRSCRFPIAILKICRRKIKISHFDGIITRKKDLLRNLQF